MSSYAAAILAVSGCGKAPPSRRGIGELRYDNSAEHLLQSRHHPVRLQDANDVHGQRRRVDENVHVYRNRQCVGKRNAKYFRVVTRAMSCSIGGGVGRHRFLLSRRLMCIEHRIVLK